MLRRVIAGLLLVGMAIGVWILWPDTDNADSSTGTTALASEPTTPPASSAPPTIAPAVSTTTLAGGDDHVVETVEEAEAILRELWFGWFEGIYDRDEDRIREVVATEEQVEAAVAQFGVMEFDRRPTPEGVSLSNTELLRNDQTCLAVWSELDVSRIRPEAVGSAGVYVMRRVDREWVLLSVWPRRNDLWDNDCDSLLLS